VDLPEYLAPALRERGWTKPRFADEVGVSFGLVYKWLDENADTRVTPGPSSCEKIAAALGVDADVILELAGHRKPRRARAHISARRQAVRDQVDRWLAAVGEDNEEVFWNSLKAHGDSTVALINNVGTAVNAPAHTAVNRGAVGAAASSGGLQRRMTGRRLRPAQRAANHSVTPCRTRRPGARPSHPQPGPTVRRRVAR